MAMCSRSFFKTPGIRNEYRFFSFAKKRHLRLSNLRRFAYQLGSFRIYPGRIKISAIDIFLKSLCVQFINLMSRPWFSAP